MKTRNQVSKLSLLMLSMLFCSLVFAQQENKDSAAQVYQIIKNDNSTYVGIVLSDDGREVLLQTETLGKIYIPKSDIKSMKKFDQKTEIIHGEASISNSFATRYSFTTNALPIKKGENYSMVNLYGPEVHFALTDHFSLGVMSTWIASPVVLAAKYSAKTGNEKVNVSVGALLGTSSYINNFKGSGGLLFANVTLGDREKNITLAGGYGYLKPGRTVTKYKEGVYQSSNFIEYTSGSPEPIKGPVVSVAGIYKVGAKASLVLDAMLGMFSQDEVVQSFSGGNVINTKESNQYSALFVMPGMRFQTSDCKAFQVSLAGVTMSRKTNDRYTSNDPVSFPLPMVTWFRNF